VPFKLLPLKYSSSSSGTRSRLGIRPVSWLSDRSSRINFGILWSEGMVPFKLFLFKYSSISLGTRSRLGIGPMSWLSKRARSDRFGKLSEGMVPFK